MYSFNFHLSKNIFFRRPSDTDTILIVRAKDFQDEGEILCKTDLSGLCSIVSGLSPYKEQHGSFDYIYNFLKHGVMYCGGCGCKLSPETIIGYLSIINITCCKECYENKFKPLYDRIR